MAEGDRILLLTDGITEACDKDGTGYGEEAILGTIYSHKDNPRILDMIYQEALEFSSSTALDDDATLLEIQKFTP